MNVAVTVAASRRLGRLTLTCKEAATFAVNSEEQASYEAAFGLQVAAAASHSGNLEGQGGEAQQDAHD